MIKGLTHLLLSTLLLFPLTGSAAESTIVLDAIGVANLRIETQTVEETTFETTLFALGHLDAIARKTGSVSSRIAGRVIEWKVGLGDRVEKGDIVGLIESRQPGDPPPVVPLRAPLAGVVTQSLVKIGQPVEPETSLLEISDLSEMDAIAKVPEHQLGQLPQGAQARIRVTAFPDQSFTGELLRLGTTLDPQSGTLPAFFRLPNPEQRLKPGMRCEFSIVLEKREAVTSIPKGALQGEGAHRFVFVKHFDLPFAFVKTAVEIGAFNDERVEIKRGLFPADEVVTQGAYSLAHAGDGAGPSLKEALDAAHGHEHAADGSELSPDARAAAKETDADDHHDHAQPAARSGWMYVSGALLLLLLASFGSHFLPGGINRRKAP